MEDFIAAAVFITALAALFVMAMATIKPFLPSKTVEVPAAPSSDVRLYGSTSTTTQADSTQ